MKSSFGLKRTSAKIEDKRLLQVLLSFSNLDFLDIDDVGISSGS